MTVFVYWIHFLYHTDPYNQGYIGISKVPIKRFKYHSNKSSSDNYVLYESIKNGAIQTILHTCETREEALILECKYRPKEHVGWNIIPGGTDTPNQTGKKFGPKHGMYGKKHTPEANAKRSKSLKGLRWWTDGVKNIKSKECPAGFSSGKTNTVKYVMKNKGTVGRSGKSIMTPYGKFKTIAEASRSIGMTWDKISNRVRNEKYEGWGFDG